MTDSGEETRESNETIVSLPECDHSWEEESP